MAKRKKNIDPQVLPYIQQMKAEFAKEIGVFDILQNDPGSLTAREAGYIGGSITKTLINLGLQYLKEHGASVSTIRINDYDYIQ